MDSGGGGPFATALYDGVAPLYGMQFVVEDLQRADGITTYGPVRQSYDETTELWSLRLEDGTIERKIPGKRIVYVEREPDGSDGVTDR